MAEAGTPAYEHLNRRLRKDRKRPENKVESQKLEIVYSYTGRKKYRKVSKMTNGNIYRTHISENEAKELEAKK